MLFPVNFSPITAAQASPFGGVNMNQDMSSALDLRNQTAESNILPSMLQQALMKAKLYNQYYGPLSNSQIFANKLNAIANFGGTSTGLAALLGSPTLRTNAGATINHLLGGSGVPTMSGFNKLGQVFSNAGNYGAGNIQNWWNARMAQRGGNPPANNGSPPPQSTPGAHPNYNNFIGGSFNPAQAPKWLNSGSVNFLQSNKAKVYRTSNGGLAYMLPDGTGGVYDPS